MNSKVKSSVPSPDIRRQIVGFSLPPGLAAEVKIEAARRNISLKELFSELWEIYKKSNGGSA